MWHTSSYSPAEITPSMVGVVPCGAYSVRVGTAFFRLRFSRRRTRARLALVAASMRLARVRKEEWARKRRRRAQASCRNFCSAFFWQPCEICVVSKLKAAVIANAARRTLRVAGGESLAASEAKDPSGWLIGGGNTPSAGGHGSAARRARLCLRAPAEHLLRTSSASALPCGGGRSSCTWPSHGSSYSCAHKGPWCKLPSENGGPWLPLPCAFMKQRSPGSTRRRHGTHGGCGAAGRLGTHSLTRCSASYRVGRLPGRSPAASVWPLLSGAAAWRSGGRARSSRMRSWARSQSGSASPPHRCCCPRALPLDAARVWVRWMHRMRRIHS